MENDPQAIITSLRDAILICDEQFEVRHCNELMKSWLATEEILDLTDGISEPKLTLEAASQLERMLRNTTEGQVFLPAQRGNGDLCVQMSVRQLTETPWAFQSQDGFLLIVVRYRTSLRKWLIDTYGLTRVEAHLAILLGRGVDMSAAAKDMKVSIHTARKYLQSVFDKTGVHRQVELVSLLHLQYAGSHLPT